jgi:hypothetical protein
MLEIGNSGQVTTTTYSCSSKDHQGERKWNIGTLLYRNTDC